MLAAGGCRREQSFTWFSFILEQPSSPDRTRLVQAGLATFAARHQTPVNTQSGALLHSQTSSLFKLMLPLHHLVKI